jgi:hypothetical protein
LVGLSNLFCFLKGQKPTKMVSPTQNHGQKQLLASTNFTPPSSLLSSTFGFQFFIKITHLPLVMNIPLCFSSFSFLRRTASSPCVSLFSSVVRGRTREGASRVPGVPASYRLIYGRDPSVPSSSWPGAPPPLLTRARL